MVARNKYVPPAYIPLGQSDVETDSVPPASDVVPSTLGIKRDPSQWSSGICACFDDMQSCCVGLFCPCYLFAKNAQVLGSGTLMESCMMHFILWAIVNTFCCMLTEGLMLGLPGCFVACYACGYGTTLRSNYNLEGYFLLYLVGFYSFPGSITQGLPTMLTRVTKVSPVPIYLQFRHVFERQIKHIRAFLLVDMYARPSIFIFCIAKFLSFFTWVCPCHLRLKSNYMPYIQKETQSIVDALRSKDLFMPANYVYGLSINLSNFEAKRVCNSTLSH